MLDGRPAAWRNSRLGRPFVHVFKTCFSEGRLWIGLSLAPQFAQPGIDANVGLLVADWEKVFTEVNRTRVATINIKRRGRVMPIGDVSVGVAKWIVGEIKI